MSVLRAFEDKISGLVEGTFGRMFRSQVRPVEIARKLAREMDEQKTISVARTYAPNEFVVWLSQEDREHLREVEREIADELAAYLLEHARRERLALVARPEIEFRTDERLGLGEFGIESHLVRHEEQGPSDQPPPARRRPPPPLDDRTAVVSAGLDATAATVHPAGAVLVAEGRRLAITATGATIGRSRDCDVVLADASVSRHHAELRPSNAGGWTIADLGSTNGVRVNGRLIGVRTATTVHDGDELEIGSLAAVFEVG